MKSHLPQFYEEILEFNWILSTESKEMELINNSIEETNDQYFIETATWGLARREKLFGISINESKPIEQRRSLIKSMIRGAGTTTVDMIKNVAEAYSNGSVEVIENNAAYSVIIKFVGSIGIPPNIPDFEKALREIIPAHLAYTLEYTFVTYEETFASYATYDALVTSGITYDALLIAE